MAPKRNTPDATIDTPIASDAPPADAGNNGVNEPPYDAHWINVAAASKLANVTTQTVRNAYREHAAFTPEVDGSKRPAYFTTKMKDQFGNVTDYDVVYLDKAAVDAWIVARAEKAASGGNIGGKHGGAKRRIIRLTDEQIAANPTITLVDGTVITVEVPPMGKHKKAADASASNGVEVTTAETESAADAGDLFDVALVEEGAAS